MSASMVAGHSGAAHQSNSEQRRARRAELRQFYGLKAGDVSKAAEQFDQPVVPSNAVSALDDPTFDSQAYYEALIAKATLPELMQTVTSLSADIGNLQGSRHSLVYNHHHQLFAAGDTISHLNSRTPQLLGIMTKLQQSFSEISRLAEEVSMDGPVTTEENGIEWESEDARLEMLLAAKAATVDIRARYEMLKTLAPEGMPPVLEKYQKVISTREAGQQNS